MKKLLVTIIVLLSINYYLHAQDASEISYYAMLRCENISMYGSKFYQSGECTIESITKLNPFTSTMDRYRIECNCKGRKTFKGMSYNKLNGQFDDSM